MSNTKARIETTLEEDFKRIGIPMPSKTSAPAGKPGASGSEVTDLTVARVVASVKKSLEGQSLSEEQIHAIVESTIATAQEAQSPESIEEMKKAKKAFVKFKAVAGRMGRKFNKKGMSSTWSTVYGNAKGKLGAMAKAAKPAHGESRNETGKLLAELADVLSQTGALSNDDVSVEASAFANLALTADLLARLLVPIQNGVAEGFAEGAFDENDENDIAMAQSIAEMVEVFEQMADLAAEFAEMIGKTEVGEDLSETLKEDVRDMMAILMTTLEMYDEFQEDVDILEAGDDDDEKDEDEDDDEDSKKGKKKKDDDDDEEEKDKKGKKPPFGKAG